MSRESSSENLDPSAVSTETQELVERTNALRRDTDEESSAITSSEELESDADEPAMSEANQQRWQSISKEVNKVNNLLGIYDLRARSTISMSDISQIFKKTATDLTGISKSNRVDFFNTRKKIFELLSPAEQQELMNSHPSEGVRDRIIKGSYYVECIFDSVKRNIKVKITDNKHNEKFYLLYLNNDNKISNIKAIEVTEKAPTFWLSKPSKEYQKQKSQHKSISQSFNQFTLDEQTCDFYLSKTAVGDEAYSKKIDAKKLGDKILEKLTSDHEFSEALKLSEPFTDETKKYEAESDTSSSSSKSSHEHSPEPRSRDQHASDPNNTIKISIDGKGKGRVSNVDNENLSDKAFKYLSTSEIIAHKIVNLNKKDNTVSFKYNDDTAITTYAFNDNQFNFNKSLNNKPSQNFNERDFEMMLDTIENVYGRDAKIEFTNVPEAAKETLKNVLNGRIEDIDNKSDNFNSYSADDLLILKRSYEGALRSLDKLSKDESPKEVPSDDEDEKPLKRVKSSQGFNRENRECLLELNKLAEELKTVTDKDGSSINNVKKIVLPKIEKTMAGLREGKSYDKDTLEKEINSYNIAIKDAREEDGAAFSKHTRRNSQ